MIYQGSVMRSCMKLSIKDFCLHIFNTLLFVIELKMKVDNNRLLNAAVFLSKQSAMPANQSEPSSNNNHSNNNHLKQV